MSACEAAVAWPSVSVPISCAEAALDELCRMYGYCLGGDKAKEILANAPDGPDAFVDAVLVAEGLDPSLTDRDTRRQLREVVSDWLFDGGSGRGAKSGLPRFPEAV
jgi:hypothetical protein